jgi:hypothetical protein
MDSPGCFCIYDLVGNEINPRFLDCIPHIFPGGFPVEEMIPGEGQNPFNAQYFCQVIKDKSAVFSAGYGYKKVMFFSSPVKGTDRCFEVLLFNSQVRLFFGAKYLAMDAEIFLIMFYMSKRHYAISA